MNTSDKLGLAQVADLDGNGRADLCYLAGEAASRSLGVRLQDGGGRLGPEFIFDLEKPRGVTIRDVDGKPGSEILLIDSRTGRLKILKLQFADLPSGEVPEQLVRYGFGTSGSSRDRDWALGDFDKDGRVDVAVSDPENSQVLLFRQRAERGLDLGMPFPSAATVDGLKAMTVANQRGSDLVVLSTTEKSVGISRWDDQRLTFPDALPIDVEPIGLEVLDLDANGTPEVLFLAKSKRGRDTEYSLWAYQRKSGISHWAVVPNYPVTVPAKGTPERLIAADITGDSVPELIILQGNKPVTVLQKKNGAYAEMPVTGSLSTGSVTAAAIFPTRWKNTPGLLEPQDNFAHLMNISPESRWHVVEQFNVSEGGAKIVGAAVWMPDPKGEPELALVDTGVKKLKLFRGNGAAEGNRSRRARIQVNRRGRSQWRRPR